MTMVLFRDYLTLIGVQVRSQEVADAITATKFPKVVIHVGGDTLDLDLTNGQVSHQGVVLLVSTPLATTVINYLLGVPALMEPPLNAAAVVATTDINEAVARLPPP